MQGKFVYIGLAIFVLMDAVFLFLNEHLFSRQIVEVQRVTMIPKKSAVFITYIVLCFAFWYFVLRKNLPPWEASILGFVIHAVYELTNYSLFKKWKLETVILDTAWGAVLWGGAAYLTYEIRGL
jgi:uncharacterized membrane protein